MFYRRTDTEILCDTLISLVNKHDQAIAKNLPHEIHIKAINLLMQKLDEELKKPAVQTVVQKVKQESKQVADTAKKTFSNGKKKLKPAITVLHGASNDVMIAEHRISEDTKAAIEAVKAKEAKNEMNAEVTTAQNDLEGPGKIEEASNAIPKEEVKPVTTAEVAQTIVSQTQAPGIVTPDNIDQMANQLVD